MEEIPVQGRNRIAPDAQDRIQQEIDKLDEQLEDVALKLDTGQKAITELIVEQQDKLSLRNQYQDILEKLEEMEDGSN